MITLDRYIGMKFGRLTVTSTLKKNAKNYLVCSCDCGGTAITLLCRLKSGETKSCGCLRKEKAIDRLTKHGMSHTRLSRIWRGIKSRCTNKNHHYYKNYGGRGIKICDEWENDFSAFSEWAFDNGYDDSLTIDRIDVNGDYTPENCRWTSNKIQCNNKRNNHIVTIEGVSHTISEWSDISGIGYGTIKSRVERGWTGRNILIKPKIGGHYV